MTSAADRPGLAPGPHPPEIEPDPMDWTWVLRRGCLDCGFDVDVVPAAEIAARLRENAARWPGGVLPEAIQGVA